jgi:hypothetical protein
VYMLRRKLLILGERNGFVVDERLDGWFEIGLKISAMFCRIKVKGQ